MSNYLKALKLYGFMGTLKKLRQMRVLKFGTLVGSDEFGNKYYENLEYPYGQHRWIEPKKHSHSSMVDASWVSPSWHGWLHYSHDTPPTTNGIEHGTGIPLHETVHNSIADHYNRDFRIDWRPNPTLQRERGYGVDHPYGKAGENDFYVQPGHMQNPKKKTYGRMVEAWGGTPMESNRKATSIKRQPWEEFYEQRKRMNAALAKGTTSGTNSNLD